MKPVFIILTIIIVTIISYNVTAQTNTFPSSGAAGIGTTTPDASSKLEIVSTTKGILIPRMTVTQRNAISSPATSLLIYQTNNTPGFYYYTGSVWKALSSNSGVWKLTGNSGTTSSNFLGTTDVQPLRFRVNNKNSGIIDYNLGTAAFGYLALNSNTATGSTAIGYEAGYSNTSGQSNTAIGSSALLSNTTGTENTATGAYSLYSGNSSYNTANGYYALSSNSANNNTAVGAFALHANTTATDNAALGQKAGYDNTTGIENTFIGSASGGGSTTGSSNTFIGYNTGTSSGNGNNNICIGANAAITNSANNSIVIGNGVTTGQNYTIVLGNTPNPFGEDQIGIGTSTPASSNKIHIVTGFTNAIYATTTVASGNAIVGEANGASIPYAIWGKTTNTDLGQAGYFDGNVSYTGTLTHASDEKLKENIKRLSNALTIVNELKPSTFNFKNDYASMSLPKGKQFGFIAQDVEKVLPELVVNIADKSKDITNPVQYKAVDYIGMIPVLTAAIQKLSQTNTALKQEVNAQQKINADLQSQIDQLKSMMINQSTVNSQQSTVLSSVLLQQNIPNPFSNSTTINYTLPKQFLSAKIIVTDKNGNALKQINLSAGKGSVTVDASTLSSGAYQYSLFVDGKKMDTKQMVLSK